MEIIINNQTRSLSGHSSLSVQQLLNIEIPLKQKGIAIAVNSKVVPKADWENKIISNNDIVLIIKATQGG